MTFEGVCFDFGDTLFYSPDGAAVLTEAGIAPERARVLWDKIWSDSKTPEALAVQRDLSPEAHRAGWLALFAQADVHKPGTSLLLYERVMDHTKWIPFPDTEAVLRELKRRGVKVGVVSNVAEDLRPVFAEHGWPGLVDGYAHSFEHRVEKPNPKLFLAACAAIGTTPERTLVVGDHPVDGGAVVAGCTVLLLPRTGPGKPHGLARVLDLLGN
ncbi:MAG: HAD family hydrolase [Chloroflexota bacterium]